MELNVPQVPEIPEITEIQLASVEVPEVPKVAEVLQEETPENPENILQNIAPLAGAAAIAGSGAALWSKLADNKDKLEDVPSLANDEPKDTVSPTSKTPAKETPDMEIPILAQTPDAETPTVVNLVTEDEATKEVTPLGNSEVVEEKPATEEIVNLAPDIPPEAPPETPPQEPSLFKAGLPLVGGAVLASSAVAIAADNQEAAATPIFLSQQSSPTPEPTPLQEEKILTSHINLNPRTPKWAYTSWGIAEIDKQALKKQGGTQLTLRLYDVTDTDLSYQAPSLVQQYECEETTHDRYVAIPVNDRDYMTEIGYLTPDNQWLPVVRSHPIRVFSRPDSEFWFVADAELIIHGATQPGATVTIGNHRLKLKPDGTFHLRVPFSEELIEYLMTCASSNTDETKTIHLKFNRDMPKDE